MKVPAQVADELCSWWVNRVDSAGNNAMFEGGFLRKQTDNVARWCDRGEKFPSGAILVQSDCDRRGWAFSVCTCSANRSGTG